MFDENGERGGGSQYGGDVHHGAGSESFALGLICCSHSDELSVVTGLRVDERLTAVSPQPGLTANGTDSHIIFVNSNVSVGCA